MRNIPAFAKFIINRLNDCGYEAYLVGGCVRDSILGKEPKDWDITTSAKPDEVIDIFDSSIAVEAVVPTGIEFGTVTIVGINNHGSYEITTFRGDIYSPETGISHIPKCVEYIEDIEQDLSRRDFTINAIAYDIVSEEYIDPFNGRADIENKIIKFVGDPEQRIKEDPLRILRGIRFASVLGFGIEVKSKMPMIIHSSLLEKISSERIREELNKILLSDIGNIFYRNNSCVTEAVFATILPELMKLQDVEQNNPYHCHDVFYHSIEATRIIEPKLHLRLAALFHDLGKACTKTTDENGIDHFYGHAKYSVDIAKNVMKRLKYDNKTIDKVLSLIKHHDRRVELSEKAIKKAMRDIGEDLFFDWCKLRYADVASQEPTYLKARAKKVFDIEDKAHLILASQDPFTLNDLAVNGNHLIALGFKPGPHIGQVLNTLLEHVIENPMLNEKENLLNMASSYLI